MAKKKKLKLVANTMADVRMMAKKHSGTVEKDGFGGYEVLAPIGRRWIDAEVWCYVLPLGECETPEEKRELMQECVELIANGHEPLED